MRPFLADVLTWPGNRAYVTAIKAAQSFSVPPTVLILTNRQPADGWSPTDKKLAVAYQILEDETCQDCGIPVWLGHSDDEHVVFDIKSRICYGCAETEKAQERESSRKGKRSPTKGKKSFIQVQESDELPSRQQFYVKQSGIIDSEE